MSQYVAGLDKIDFYFMKKYEINEFHKFIHLASNVSYLNAQG
jgi:hypothetical protein